MSKVTMPKPVLTRRVFHPSTGEIEQHLITTTQAEAYKDACLRAALEEAAQICWEMQSKPEYGKDDKDRWLAIAESRIRALIPTTK